jgi:hypothetical protein
VHRSVDVTKADTPSVWAYPQILPHQLFAFPLIEQVPCASPFDPRHAAVLNTVTIFGPRDDLVDFPFDALVISRVYGFYYILALRRSFMNKLRSHMYPPAVAELPWSESLIQIANDLRKLRSSFFDACERRYAQGEGLVREIQSLPLQPFRMVYRAATKAPLLFSAQFEDGENFLLDVGEPIVSDDVVSIPLSEDGHAIALPAGSLAQLVAIGLKPHNGEEFSRTKLLTTPVPPNDGVAAQLVEIMKILHLIVLK